MTWDYVDQIASYGDHVTGVAIDAGGGRVAVADRANYNVDVYEYGGNWQLLRSFDNNGNVNYSQDPSVAFSPDGNWLFASDYDNGNLNIWDVSSDDHTAWGLEQRRSTSHTQCQAVATDPTSTYVAIGGDAAVTDVYEIGTWNLVTDLPATVDDWTGAVAFSPDGGYIGTANTNPYEVSIFEVGATDGTGWNHVTELSDTTNVIGQILWTHAGDKVAVCDWDGQVFIYQTGNPDGSGWDLLDDSITTSENIFSLAFDISDTYLLVPDGVDTTSRIDVYNTADWSFQTELNTADNYPGTVDIDSYVVFGDEGGSVYVHHSEIIPVEGQFTVDEEPVGGATVAGINDTDGVFEDATETAADGWYELHMTRGTLGHIKIEGTDPATGDPVQAESKPFIPVENNE